MKTKEEIQEALAAYRVLLSEYKFYIRMSYHLEYEDPQSVLQAWNEEIVAATETIDALEYVLGLNEEGMTACIIENTFTEIK